MKQDVFNQYVDKVTNLFGIDKENFFSKHKSRELADARHMVYYLCAKRPMKIIYIQKYMNENGYDVQHPTVIHGIKKIEERIKEDSDISTILKELDRTVYI
jgi:chromosomal replication initiation ATPase DnaA